MAIDKEDKCCKKKTIVVAQSYKFCTLCDRAYNMNNNEQINNWAWEKRNGKWEKVLAKNQQKLINFGDLKT